MPIYECHCLGCDLTFEVLAPLSQAGRRHPCPRCARPAPRIASAFAIASGAGARESQAQSAAAKKPGAPEAPPLCLRYPHVPLLCHMDQKAARRWLAHYNGRGAEYDDKHAAREELRNKRGLPPEPPPPAHGHEHGRNFRRHQAQGAAEHGDAHHHGHGGDHDHHEPHGGDERHDRPGAGHAHKGEARAANSQGHNAAADAAAARGHRRVRHGHAHSH